MKLPVIRVLQCPDISSLWASDIHGIRPFGFFKCAIPFVLHIITMKEEISETQPVHVLFYLHGVAQK
jgi:hypothetical protein